MSRRPVQFAHSPTGWNELAQIPAFETRLAKLKEVVVWPGKPGAAGLSAVTPLTSEQQSRFATGKTLYTAVCASCHQISGRGLDRLIPPLLDSEWVLGSPEHAVRIVLHGVRGELRVIDRMYTGDMPPFGALDDQQISAILTYLRRAWGHIASPVAPEEVGAIRAATADRADAWAWAELKHIARTLGSIDLERPTARP
jgi:mono/diheme cytochrome c family protein